MKSTPAKPKKKEIGFPKLMVSVISANIYLMSSETSGTIVGSDDKPFNTSLLGQVRSQLDHTHLEDFHGSVTLENE